MSNQIMNGTYTSPNLPPNIVGLGEYSDKDLLAELVNRGVIDAYKHIRYAIMRGEYGHDELSIIRELESRIKKLEEK